MLHLLLAYTFDSAITAVNLCSYRSHSRSYKPISGFDDGGARINERIHEVWNALLSTFTVKELYVNRYAKLMQEKGINT